MIDDLTIFCSGNMNISYEVIRRFKDDKDKSITSLQSIAKQTFEVMSGLSDSSSLEIIVLYNSQGEIHQIQMAHYTNFEQKYTIVSEGIGVYTGGIHTETSLEKLTELIINSDVVDVKKVFTQLYEEISCEEIGGNLKILEVGYVTKEIYDNTINDRADIRRLDVGFNPHLVIAEMVLGKIILGQRVVIGDTTGVFTIEGSKLMIDDRCGRPVVRLGLLSEAPDKFGFILNRYASTNCNDLNIVNRVMMTADEGFSIERKNGSIFDKTFYTSTDGDLYMKGNFQAGEGERIFKVTHTGFQLGGSVWETAPLHADMFGNVWMNKLFADSAEIKNSLFKDGHIRGSDLELRDTKGGIIKMYPEWGLWFGHEDFDKAPASISMDGTAKFKKLIVTDGNNTLLMDSEKKQLHLNRWDIVGAGAIDTELLAANILTAEDGFISSLVAGKLSTLTNAALQGWSNYVKIEGKEIKFLTGKVKGSGVHKELSDGRKLYWLSSEQKGEMTVEVTPWPVYVYEMEDKTKMRLFFEGDGEQAYPIIDMGEGDSRGYGRGSIQKPNGSFDFVYLNSNYGREKSLRLTDDGVTLLSELGPINIKGKEINLITESGSAIKMTSDGDIEIKASKNVKINGTRIDLN